MPPFSDKWKFIRTCQCCGHQQEAKDPATYKNKAKEAWRDVKCRKCKSDALDYGSKRPTTQEEIEELEADDARQAGEVCT